MTTNIVVTESIELNRTRAPALPFAPVEYDRQYIDTFSNILRQYFNTLDNFIGQLTIDTGTAGFPVLPHIAAQDSTDQYATATNTPTKVLWNTLDSGSGFTLNIDSTATPTYTGVYKIDYSLQFLNTDTQIHDLYVWLRVDGVDVAGSASIFSVPNKHGGIDGALIAYSSLTFSVTAGQDIALYWTTNQAATSGGANGIYMHAAPTQTSPFTMPSIPSAVGSIVFVSGPTA
jgi:hypothetical protein